ncbi:MAG: hypothetical protein ACRDNS_32770 [Trebonia sp.]
MNTPTATRFRIVTPFPSPPPPLGKVLHQHDVARRADPDEIAREDDLSDLPRPWTPAACGDDLRVAIWDWCDAVAEWLNHEYAWRPAQLVPPCWPYHPHIAHELPILALQRYHAGRSDGPELLDQWHRESLPLFFERMHTRLGESKCRTGTHQDWPAEPRQAAYTTPDAVQVRRAAFFQDTNPGAPLRAVRDR